MTVVRPGLATAGSYPLLRHDRLDATIAFHKDRPVTAGDFLNDAARLAVGLPDGRYAMNLCQDRYRFAVGFVAALMREQVTLLPPTDAPAVLEHIAAAYDGAYCLHDGGDAPPADLKLRWIAYPEAALAHRAGNEIPAFPAEQAAVVLFTSGSTGKSLPHVKSWGCLARSAQAAAHALNTCGLAGAAVVGTVPQQHSYGFESTIMLPLQHRLAIHGARPFYPGDIIACVAACPRPRVLVTTPIHLRALLEDDVELPPVDLILSATAPLATPLAIAAERRFGARLLEIYGCSETGQIATRRTATDEMWDCLDGMDLRQDETGTWASGALADREVLLADVIELAAPGRFRLQGRTADLVNIAGKRTSLAHLNHHLNSLPGVVDGVFVMPEETDGTPTRLMALAVAPGVAAETLLAALRQRIDPVFLPRPLLLIDALPRNLLGKLPRAEILRLVAQHRG